MFWRIYAIDAPHSICQFIELVCSAHLFAIWVGKRVNQPNGIVSKTNELKLCLLKVGLFWGGSINSSTCHTSFFGCYKKANAGCGGALRGLIEPY